MKKLLVSVIGGHKCDDETSKIATEAGRIIASSGAVLVCGGLGGIMEAACLGAKEAGGTTIGIIPGENKEDANQYVDIAIPTGMGYSRNTLVAGTGDIVIALKGEYGTLSEISFALISNKKVYSLNSWDIPGVEQLSSIRELKSILAERV